ncbi:hypothetical protein MIR68_003164 [Amoeboaphelidium protococcarum]|nr:hypothetical protein MIR68_003164 [Amoeboaphelidium protococcarum]
MYHSKFLLSSRLAFQDSSSKSKTHLSEQLYNRPSKLSFATRQTLFWTTSLTLFAISTSIFVYSWHWNKHRFQAMREGRDLDQWADEFAQQDPATRFVNRLSSIGQRQGSDS